VVGGAARHQRATAPDVFLEDARRTRSINELEGLQERAIFCEDLGRPVGKARRERKPDHMDALIQALDHPRK
jgi:hypothetical protein